MIKFKRLTIALLALLSISTTAWADGSWTCGGCSVKLEGTTLTVSKSASGNGRMADYTYYYERGWDSNASSVKNLVIEEGVVYLGNRVFGKFTGITEVNIPSSVTGIGVGTFQQCWALKTVTIKAASCTLGNDAFFDNEEMKQIYVPRDKVTDYKNADGWSAYQGIILAAPAAPGEVTISDDKSEATFTMPQYDVTATYALKRDMAVEMSVSVQDAEQNSRFRVQKQGNNFVPVGLTNEQVIALFKVHDDIESKDLTAATDYTVQIFAADDDGQPTGTAMTFQTFTYAPGQYIVKAVAAEGSNYSGETALSNVFTLFQGYEVEVAAKEFITYYKDEPLYADTETSADAQLYTITSVSADQAVLSAAIETAPSLTPLLIFNNSDQAKTFLLIPANEEPNLQLTVAPEFVGTLEATTIAASTDDQTNYAFNGKAFVFVKNAIEVGPNKAWLSVNTGVPSARITIVFDETTGIDAANSQQPTANSYYDLNGRKLDKMPTKKGIYLFNGRKVVIK